MLFLKIKPHGPEEKPAHSCKVIASMTWQEPIILDYSKKYDAWNCRDTDNEENAKLTAMGAENMIGWVYADEIFWQTVIARREVEHEAQ